MANLLLTTIIPSKILPFILELDFIKNVENLSIKSLAQVSKVLVLQFCYIDSPDISNIIAIIIKSIADAWFLYSNDSTFVENLYGFGQCKFESATTLNSDLYTSLKEPSKYSPLNILSKCVIFLTQSLPAWFTLLEKTSKFKFLFTSKVYRLSKVFMGITFLLQRLLYTFEMTPYSDPIIGTIMRVISGRANIMFNLLQSKAEVNGGTDILHSVERKQSQVNMKMIILFTVVAILKLLDWIRQQNNSSTDDEDNMTTTNSGEDLANGSALVKLLKQQHALDNNSNIDVPQSRIIIPPPKFYGNESLMSTAPGMCSLCREPRKKTSASTGGFLYCYDCLNNVTKCPISNLENRETDIINIYEEMNERT